MTERQAVHYGQVEIIPGIQCDGYVLDDGMASYFKTPKPPKNESN